MSRYMPPPVPVFTPDPSQTPSPAQTGPVAFLGGKEWWDDSITQRFLPPEDDAPAFTREMFLTRSPDQPVSIKDHAQIIGRMAWMLTRRTIYDYPVPFLLVEAETNAIRAASPSKVPKKWSQRVTAALRDMDYDTDRLPPPLNALLGAYSRYVYPDPDTLCMIELQLTQEATDKLSDGESKTDVLLYFCRTYGWPLSVSRDVISLAEQAADRMEVTSKTFILAGMQKDLKTATRNSDVRASIAARKSLAQATGVMKSHEKSATVADFIDVMARLGRPADDPAEIEE